MRWVLFWAGVGEPNWCGAGAEQGEVIAVFDLPAGHAAHAVLAEAGIDAEDELILRRVNYRRWPQNRLGQ